ncbi:MAG: hypothetical protein GY838_06425 [bacterium]|nr:hypothetical protein [bacterium]
MNTPAIVRRLLAGMLLTLPWVGMGVGRLVTGRDLGFGLQPAWFLLGAAAVPLLFAVRPEDIRSCLPRSWLVFAGAAVAALALSALGLRIAPVQEESAVVAGRFLRQVVQLGLMAAFLVLPACWVRGTARWRFTARWLVAGAWLQVAYAGLQYLHWHHPGTLLPALEQIFTSNPAILSGSEQLHVGDGFRDMPRLRGTMCEPLYLGNYLLAVLPLVSLAGWNRWLSRATTLLLAVVLLLTWSRGAWAAGAVAGLVALVLARGRWRRPGRSVLLGSVAAVVVLAVALGPDRLLLPWERLIQSLSTRDWSNLTRLYSFQAAWRAFQLSPAVGVGWGQFAWHFPVLVDPMGLQSQFTWPVVNSFPLRVLCETGLVGFGVFAGAAAAIVRQVARAVRRPDVDPERLRPVAACTVAVAGVWTQFLVFSQYNLPHIWLVAGLLLAALRETGEETQ